MNSPQLAISHNRPRKADLEDEYDGCWRKGSQKVWVEVKSRTHSFRNVRASMLGLAYRLSVEPESRALLVLADSRITQRRLSDEKALAEKTLRPEVANRLSLVLGTEQSYLGLPKDLESNGNFLEWLNTLVAKESREETKPRQTYYAVVEVMLHQWLLGKGPVTNDWIAKTVGCSYPTVAGALERLGYEVVRFRDRRAVLRRFPSEEWARLVTLSDEVRNTARFVDRSGQPRSPQSLLRRLGTLGRDDLAVGGIEGARHFHSGIDLIGLPRLDLSLHCPSGHADLSFIEQLDPGLKRTEKRDEPASVVVHLVRRIDPLFEAGAKGMLWADPVECLLDLHEARLESQAKELIDFLVKKSQSNA